MCGRTFIRLIACALACAASFAASATAQPIRILPLGDSITHGASYGQVNPTNFVGGYRAPLYDMLTNAGHTVQFVGTRTQNSTGMASPAHEGYPGFRISNWWNRGAGGIYETIWDTFARIQNPHIILLHVGTNDSGDHPFANTPVQNLNQLLDRLVAFEPGAEIVLSSLMYRTEVNNWNWITNSFNPALPGIVATRRARGEKIHFLDLADCIYTNGLSDTVHPNELGYRLMAEKWFGAITNIVAGAWQPDDTLSVLYTVTNDSPNAVTFKVNGELDATSVADVSHYALPGATITRATLAADKHTVTVSFASPVPYDTVHTLAVTGLANAAGTATLTATVPFEVSGRGAARHVALADRRGYRKVATYDFPAQAILSNNVAAVYSEDLRGSVGAFSRVAYFFELRPRGGSLQWLWTSMDAFTDDARKLGVPTVLSGAFFDCYVSNLVIRSNVPGITPGTRALGNLECWPWNYSAGRGNFTLPNGSADTLDFDDAPSMNGNFGSFQIHDFENRTTLFSWTGWGGYRIAYQGDSYPTIGLGNAPSGHPDWTYTGNGSVDVPGCAADYDIMRMEIYVLDASGDVKPPEPLTASLSASRNLIDVTFDEAVSTVGLDGAFSLGSDARILHVERSASNAKVVTLMLDRAVEANCLFLRVRGVRDLSPAANAISAEGVTVTVTQGASSASAATLVFQPRRAVASADRTRVCVSCAYAVPSAYIDPARYVFTGGAATVVRALRSSAERRDVILELAAPLAADTAYTLNVTLVDNTTKALAFRTMGAASSTFTAANIPELADYSLVNYLDIPTSAAFSNNGADYTLDESRFDAHIAFDRVAYCLELVKNGATNWVWVSLDAPTNDASKIGVPTVERQNILSGYVHNLKVYSGLSGDTFTLATSGDLDEGNIEFWPGNFSGSNTLGIPGASSTNFDWGDAVSSMSCGWGSMQIHNYKGQETIFAFNSYGYPSDSNKAVTTEMGIGNRPGSQHTDWISAANSAEFSYRRLSVFVRRTPAATDVGEGPVFIVDPHSVTARAGRASRFVAFAAGATRYQWRKNGAVLPFEVNPEYAFTASSAAVGTYDVLAYDADGNVSTSGTATFTLDTDAEDPSPAIRILPLGDSITWGYSVNGGYRAPLYNLLTGAGWDVTFCGSQTANSTDMVSPRHEGHSGYVLSNNYCPAKNGLLEGLPDWFTSAENPHIVLLHAGTNDGNDAPSNLALYGLDNLSSLVDAIAEAQPGAEIVVTTLLPRDYGLHGTDGTYAVITNTFNPGIPALVNIHRAKGQKVHFFDLNPYLTLSDTADGVHPNAAGYAKMAQGWFDCLTNMVPHVGEFTPDDTPATVRRTIARAEIVLDFNEAMSADVLASGNFVFSNPSITVASAGFAGSSRAVRLVVSGVPDLGADCTLTVKGGTNAAGTFTLAETTYPISFEPIAGAGELVSDVGVYAGFRDRVEIDVAAGAVRTQTNAVFQEGNSTIFKTGAGTWQLPLTAFRQGQPFNLGVREGTLDLSRGTLLPIAGKPTALLNKAALWLAAKNDEGARSLKMIVTNGLDGTTYVAKWCDERETTPANPSRFYAIPAWSDAAYTQLTGVPPTFTTTNGIPGVYFGGYTSGKCMTIQSQGAFKNIPVIRDIFLVHGAYKTYGYVLANADRSNEGWNSYINAPTTSMGSGTRIWTSQLIPGPCRTGWTFLDGAFVANPYTTTHPTGTHLLSVKSERTDGNLSGFYNNQFYQNRQGGDYLNEVVVFTNELTVAERASVTRYLMQKWNLTPAPGTTAGTVEVAEGATARLTVAADESAPELTVNGMGTFEKAGAGTLALQRNDFRGSLHVAGGAVTSQGFEDVPLALKAGEAVTATHGFEGSSVAVAASAQAGTTTLAGADHVRVQEIDENVQNLRVTAGTLVLAAPRAASVNALPPGYDPVVTNGTFERNSGSMWTKFQEGVENYGWWRSGGLDGNIWQLHSAHPFGKLPYMASDSDWFLNIQGDDSYIYTRVRIDRAGVYEFSFDCASREYFDRYLITVKIGTSLANLTDLAAFKTQCQGAFVRAAFRTPILQPGSYLFGFRADTTGTMATDKGGALFDNVRVAYVAESTDSDVWPIPNGDFEKLTSITSASDAYSSLDYRNTAEGWTFDNDGQTDAALTPYVSFVSHGMLGGGYMIYSPRANARGMTELFFANTNGRARTTFRPPAGTWKLRADLSSCPLYFRNVNPWNWSHTSGYLAASVTAGGVTTSLGSASHATFVMGPATLPTAFTVDGETDVTLELRNADNDKGSCLVDNLVLVRVDRSAADHEFVEDGSFETTAQAGYNQPMTGTRWRTTMNNVGQKFSYCYVASYANYYPTQIGQTTYDGNKLLLVCGSGILEQDLDLDAGDFEFSMWTGSRYSAIDGNSTNSGLNPLKVYIYPTGGNFATDAVEIGSYACVTRAFTKRVAFFHVPTAGSYTLRIQGQTTAANSDRIARVDGVSVKRARLAAATPSLPETLELAVDAGAKLCLAYPGTNEVSRLSLGGAGAAGVVTAKTHPAFISGPGALFVRPKGTVFIFR